MIINFFYSLFIVFYLSKKTPQLFKYLIKDKKIVKIKNQKKKANNDTIHKLFTILFGIFGIHNMYEEKYIESSVKFTITLNYFLYSYYFLIKYKNEYDNNLKTFIKKLSDNNNIKLKETDSNNKIKFIIHSPILYNYEFQSFENYIRYKNKNFYKYKNITELLFFVNLLLWVVDIIHIII